ncbi:unnamed protein product [Caenorhabditis bovis]|uniref:Uncharacterized protein n=1 Tax=Caenorhabditis bovis TaxID=2654633 RepID=A0A8S1F4B8_9PELO|nr:unnamed protein product [Caenorhabditis bovis]
MLAGFATIAPLHDEVTSGTSRASHLIVEVPIEKIKNIDGAGSIHRETKHFTNTTTMHGPKRIFNGKGLAQWFWLVIVSTSLALLILQIVLLLKMYFSKPTLSQVSFIVSEGGMDFPAVTICNFNPVKKSYVKQLNASGDLSGETLEYLLQTNMNAMFLFSNVDRQEVREAHANAEIYQHNHRDFSILNFLNSSGYECDEMFNCCDYMTPRILSLGKCFELDLQTNTPEWMRKQTAPGVEAGLQIILDAHLEEEIRGDMENETNAIFSTYYENGFRSQQA